MAKIEACINKFLNFTFDIMTLYCNATFDSYLCWPPTRAGEDSTQRCPSMRLSNTKHTATRHCNENGHWGPKNENTSNGWTNYSLCFPREVRNLLTKIPGKEIFKIAQTIRYMEIVGFTISLVTLIAALCIFFNHRILSNTRTRIHKNLCSIMAMQVVIRLIQYIDQIIVRNSTYPGIENNPILCLCSYILLEYAISVMFMWMFIEGHHLHNMVSSNALHFNVNFRVYNVIAWGIPLINTTIWAGLTAVSYKDEPNSCWYGYNFSNIYLFLQLPRFAVAIINAYYLQIILREICRKMRVNANNEMEIIKKGVCSALVLLPLLGLTNTLEMFRPPLEGPVWLFGGWTFVVHFLRSFQGFFLVLFYCFLNHEVQEAIKKWYNDRMAMRMVAARLRSIRRSERRIMRRHGDWIAMSTRWVAHWRRGSGGTHSNGFWERGPANSPTDWTEGSGGSPHNDEWRNGSPQRGEPEGSIDVPPPPPPPRSSPPCVEVQAEFDEPSVTVHCPAHGNLPALGNLPEDSNGDDEVFLPNKDVCVNININIA